MKVRRLSIRNVKSIQQLDIAFEERVTLLHGANGIGKSTILDCLALLGHVTSMRQAIVGNGTVALHAAEIVAHLESRHDLGPGVASRLAQAKTRGDAPTGYEAITDALRAHGSIDRWFDDGYLRTPRIRYECETSISGESSIIRIAVAMIDRDLTVSHVLNRSRCDDLDMGNATLVLFDEGDRGTVKLFLSHQAESSSSLIRTDTAMTTIPAVPSPRIRGNRVVAINTDLADLGKRDQIRESVKDLSLYLGEEALRLGLPFDVAMGPDRKRFRFFDELGAILSRVITDPAAGRGVATKTPVLSLTSCDLESGKPRISFRRRGDEDSRGTDFLSAGENECFFVFLALLGIDTHESIILLDEPELHIAEYCRPSFFDELYALTSKRGCQVIVATHSLFALSEREPTHLLVVGQTTEPGGTIRHTCGLNPEYTLSLFKAYWRIGTLVLVAAGLTRPFRTLAVTVYHSLERLGKERPLAVGLTVGVMASAIVALISDAANFFHLQSPEEHLFLIRIVVLFAVVVASASSFLLWAARRHRE